MQYLIRYFPQTMCLSRESAQTATCRSWSVNTVLHRASGPSHSSLNGKDLILSKSSFTSPSITREAATKLVADTVTISTRIGFEPVVAIVDAAGNLKAFDRSDKGSYLAINIAIDKAYTAASFGLSTAEWVDLVEDPGASNLRHVPRVTAVAGGFPIIEDGVVIGGLGISGGSWAQDQKAGEEALHIFNQ